MKNIIIIGGGIGGLYCAYKLSQRGTKDITIIEKNNTLGGCIQSWDTPFGITIEAGAGRFLCTHTILLELIEEFKLNKTNIMNNTKDFVSSMSYESDTKYLYETLTKHTVKDKEIMKKMSFFSWASQYINTHDIRLLSFQSGYSKDFEELNAWNFMEIYKDVLHAQYYGLKGGLSQIINMLEKRCIDNGVHIEKGLEILDIQKIDGGYSLVPCVSGGQKRYSTKTLILTVPRHSLRKFSLLKNDMSIASMLKAVQKQSLMRIYAEVPYLNQYVKVKVTTDELIRYIIPIRGDVFMISYTDGRFADYWKEIDDVGKTKVVIEQCLKRMFNKQFDVKNIRAWYWKDCVHLWKPGYDSKDVTSKIINPMKSLILLTLIIKKKQDL